MADPADPADPADDTASDLSPDEPGTPTSVRSEPVEVEGEEVVISQQPVGPGREIGGGRSPDPATPPSSAAAGEEAEGLHERRARHADGTVRERVDDLYGRGDDPPPAGAASR
jgi:hypothetical protein